MPQRVFSEFVQVLVGDGQAHTESLAYGQGIDTAQRLGVLTMIVCVLQPIGIRPSGVDLRRPSRSAEVINVGQLQRVVCKVAADLCTSASLSSAPMSYPLLFRGFYSCTQIRYSHTDYAN